MTAMTVFAASDFYKPVSTECLFVGLFPSLALYLRRDNGNFILYKPEGIELSELDRERFRKNGTGFVYVRTGDAEQINSYLEENLGHILEREDIEGETKGYVLSQVLVNYISEIFKSPDRVADIGRCLELLQHITTSGIDEFSIFRSLKNASDGTYKVFTHSVDVAILSLITHNAIFAKSSEELTAVFMGALFHDIGLSFLPSNIVDGPMAYSDIDYSMMKLHPQKGYSFLCEPWKDDYEIALDVIRYHHEKFDGSGYPQGISGARIPPCAQIVSICDVYSSLTFDRPFRAATSPEKTLEIMSNESYIFNREFFAIFRKIILEHQATLE